MIKVLEPKLRVRALASTDMHRDMFFYASKLVWFIIQPSSACVLLIVLGLILATTRWRRLGRWLSWTGVVVLLIAGLSPLGNLLILPLEGRFPRPSLVNGQRAPDGIIILGGAEQGAIARGRGAMAFNEAGERLLEGALLARRFPRARVVFTGAQVRLFDAEQIAALSVAQLLERLGIARRRIVLEARARNTYQNALFSKALAKPKPGERWLLVTSAYHMARAVGCFRKVGFDVVAWPVDYRTAGRGDGTKLFDAVSSGLRRVDFALKEWLGLLVYRLTGRTNAIFPAPATR